MITTFGPIAAGVILLAFPLSACICAASDSTDGPRRFFWVCFAAGVAAVAFIGVGVLQ